MSGRTWAQRAACSGMDPEMFFPEIPKGPVTRETRGALKAPVAVCRACPVRAECLADAMRAETGLTIHHRAGIFGGRTPRQRVAADPVRTARDADPSQGRPVGAVSGYDVGADGPCGEARARRWASCEAFHERRGEDLCVGGRAYKFQPLWGRRGVPGTKC